MRIIPEPHDTCTCGHESLWHSDQLASRGTGECEHGPSCPCKVFEPEMVPAAKLKEAEAEIARLRDQVPVSL